MNLPFAVTVIIVHDIHTRSIMNSFFVRDCFLYSVNLNAVSTAKNEICYDKLNDMNVTDYDLFMAVSIFLGTEENH